MLGLRTDAGILTLDAREMSRLNGGGLSVTASVKEQTLTPQLAARVEAHHAYLANRRREQPDPLEALDEFVRNTFDRDALLATYEEFRNVGRVVREVADPIDGR